MGTVFLAEHALIKRRVAIKILHPELATDANVIERFMNEARAAGTLGHPNIVESTDMGFTNNHVPYIVFEYLEGTLLTDEIYRIGGLPVRRTARIASQIASALHAAHNADIVHRDLKSDNVFLTDKDDALDHVKVLDFGISRFLMNEDKQKGMVMGTPEFMAPEQITDPDNVDKRADIYALGVILYEMLTARRPFSNDDDPRQLLHRIVHEAPPPLMRPEVPHGLAETILGKMLAKNPADRYQSMLDVEAALESFITRSDGTPVPFRRSQPMAIIRDEDVPELPDNLHDLARDSNTIPRPAKMANTPYPGQPVDTLAMKNVMLPQAAARRPVALYLVAGIGIAVGALGLVFGLKGNKEDKTAMTPPQPTIQQPPPAASVPIPKEVQKIAIQLDADAPNSHVTFRRHVAAAPTSLSISATDVVELIEVSAPGYKTARFWLTFDRPTHLRAHLVKGNGLLEATEEETLVALGEVSAPTQAVAVAAKAEPATTKATTTKATTTKATTTKATPTAAPQVAAKTVEKPAPVAKAPVAQTVAKVEPQKVATLAPRKIGRSAADDKKPGEQPKMMTPDMPTMAAMQDEPAVPAKAEPKKAEPKDEPNLPEPSKVEPAAKTEVVAEPAVKAPSIDNATVTSVVGTHRPEVLKCFADGKKKDHGLKGTVNLQLQVDNAGKVHHIQVQSTLKDPLVAACVVKSANGWKFPARSGNGGVATVSYPFTIN